MPTKYDVFAEIIERAPCKIANLPFSVPVYAHVNTLVKQNWIKKTKQGILPVKNTQTTNAFKVIRYCLNNGLDYNKFFSKNISEVLIQLLKNAPNLRPRKLKGNQDVVDILRYMEENQFILITKKRPRRGILLCHQLLNTVLSFNHQNARITTIPYFDLIEEINRIKKREINPYSNEVFSFLSGSAQLEGSTVNIGETKELILNDIYPDKPKIDIQVVKNLNEALHYVLEHVEEDITVQHIQEINKAVLFGLHRNAGKFKTIQNRIQGNPTFKTVKPSEVPVLMEDYCRKLRSMEIEEILHNLGNIHNDLQRIHPFSDGNSRTTRMVLNWVLIKHKFPIVVIKMGSFDEYMSLTKLSGRRDDRKLTMFFHHLIVHESLLN